MVKLNVATPEALPYPTNVSQKEHTLVGNLELIIAALDNLSKNDVKAELCIVVSSIMNIKSQDLRHRSIFFVKIDRIFRDSHP